MRRLDCTRRAGCARGTGEALQVESDQEGFAFDARKKEIRGVGCARSAPSVDARVRHAVQKAVLELIAERAKALGVLCKQSLRNLSRFAEADDTRNVFGARAEAALMVAAVEKLAHTGSSTDIKRAYAFGGIQLVAGNGKQIDVKLIHVDSDFAGGLHGVRMKVNIGILCDAANFFERLHSAELVVGVHDGDQHGFRPERATEIFKIDQAILVDVQVRDVHALFF